MKIKYFLVVMLMTSVLFSCSNNTKENKNNKEAQAPFKYEVEQFADVKILRYQIPGFEELSLKQKELVYYLSQAGMVGRDIMYDQNYRHNLKIRRALEHIYTNYKGDKTTGDWKNFETYLKRIWFSNGIHHHYSNDKFKPAFSQEYFDVLLKETNTKLAGE
ncbi:Dipeptidyl-peptidase III, partial [hydrothermal vent metagenome]